MAELPAAVRAVLDVRELAPLSSRVRRAESELGTILGAHVVAYRQALPGRGSGRQLCSMLAPAQLDEDGLAALRSAEASSPDRVVLVAYARPVRLTADAARLTLRRC